MTKVIPRLRPKIKAKELRNINPKFKETSFYANDNIYSMLKIDIMERICLRSYQEVFGFLLAI
jgi:hypothetical protein